MATEITKAELKSRDLVIIGEWGFGTASSSGHIVAQRSNRKAVQAAYDAIDESESDDRILDDVIAAGGMHVVGL